jgi:hypothetical protein
LTTASRTLSWSAFIKLLQNPIYVTNNPRLCSTSYPRSSNRRYSIFSVITLILTSEF